jgi:Zn-dependent protease
MFLQFESKALPTKVVKRFGLRRISGIMEWDDALIVFYSLMPLLMMALLAKFFTGLFFSDLARYAWIYVVCNLLPISKLDGTKLFFGSIPLFIFTWAITLLTWPIVF